MQNSINRRYALLLLFWLGIPGFWALGQDSLSLPAAISIGLKENFGIQIAKAQEVIAERNNNWGTAGRFPRLDFSTSTSLFENPTSFANRGRSASLGLNLSWLMFDGFRIYGSKDRLEELERQSGINTTILLESMVQAVMLGYYQALIAMEQEQVLAQALDVSREKREFERIRKDLGTGGTFDLLEFETNYLTDSANLILQNLNVRNAIRNLNLVMGLDPEREFILTDRLTEDFPIYEWSDLRNRMVSNNTNLINQLVNLRLAEIETRISRAPLYPSVSFNVGGNYSAGNTQLIDGREINASGFQYNAGITLSYNLFNGGNSRRAIQNAKINENISRLSVNELQNSLSHQLRAEWDNFAARKQLLAIRTDATSLSSTQLGLADERLKQGLISSLDFRQIQLSLLTSSLARLQALLNVKQSEINMMRLSGSILQQVSE